MKIIPRLILLLFLAAAGWYYWQGAVKQLVFVNVDLTTTDQDATMDYARKLAESGYTFVGERNRMPLYPLLQSLFYHPGRSEEEFFTRGKYVNLGLSLVLLGLIAIILFSSFRWLHALVLELIFAFTLFIFRAGFFQAELLFYFLNFYLFVRMVRLLKKPSWRSAILAGVTAGLAHLTKASILPGLVIFLGVMALKGGWQEIKQRRQKNSGRRQFNRHFGSAVLVSLSFLVTVFPYIQNSKQLYGQYFYNVNSTFYIWYDSWEEARQGTRAHGDRRGWPDMPPEEIPSLAKYLQEHTLNDITSRFINGAETVLSNAWQSYGYAGYLLFYLFVLMGGLVVFRIKRKRFPPFDGFLLLFLGTYFTAYFLLYAWYVPITEGNRLVLAQFMPVLYAISLGLEGTLGGFKVKIGSHSIPVLDLINAAVLLVLLFDIRQIVTERIYKIYGGY